MYKKSIIIVLIQVLGLIVGFLSIYLVAGDMAPEVYSLVGIYGIVNSIVLVFSNLGVETTMMREALYWIQNNDYEKLREYTSQAIVSRILGFVILLPFVMLYLLYINNVKYTSNYFPLFLSFYIGSCVSALDDSISLIIRSQGGYVFAQFAQTLNNNIMKFVAIIVYLKFGALPYLYFFALYSIPLLFLFTNRLRKLFSFRYIKIKDTICKIKEAKYLFMRTYLDYFRSYSDSILVSFLFPSSIIGSYTLFKNFENIVKNLVDGFFDVLSQNMVKYKGSFELLKQWEKKYNYARFACLFFVVASLLVFSINELYFVTLVNLSQYEGIILILYCIGIVAVLNLMGKYELSILSLFASSKLNFNFALFAFFVTLVTYILIIFISTLQGMLLQRLLINLLITFAGYVVFYRRRKYMFSNILK